MIKRETEKWEEKINITSASCGTSSIAKTPLIRVQGRTFNSHLLGLSAAYDTVDYFSHFKILHSLGTSFCWFSSCLVAFSLRFPSFCLFVFSVFFLRFLSLLALYRVSLLAWPHSLQWLQLPSPWLLQNHYFNSEPSWTCCPNIGLLAGFFPLMFHRHYKLNIIITKFNLFP